MIEDIEDQLKKGLRRAGKKGVAQLQQDLARTGKSKPQGFPSQQSGRFRNSIMFKVEGLSVSIGTNLDYPHYLDVGTRYMLPRPWAELFEQQELQNLEKEILR